MQYRIIFGGGQLLRTVQRPSWQCIYSQKRQKKNQFSTSGRRKATSDQHQRDPFRSRLRRALNRTKVEWYPIPVGLGIGFLGFVQFYRTQQRSKVQEENSNDAEHTEIAGNANERGERPKKRERIRPSGPWYECHEQRGSSMLLMIQQHLGKYKSCQHYP